MAGFILAGSASSVLFLASGVALAGASAGFCWTPFNDAAERVSPPAGQAGVLSAVSTGATMGVALSAALYLAASVADIGWRMSWILFTAMAALALALAGRNIPAGGARSGEGAGRVHAAVFLRLELAPLYAAAFCFGAANAIYLAYAALHVVGSGGLPRLPDESAAAVVFLAYGVCGLTGLITGRIEARIGLSPLLAMIFAAFALSLIIIAVTPTAWPAVLASAGLHGAAVMMVSAALSFWSLRAFPGAGTAGFTAALIAVAAGSIAGPALAGVLVDVSDVKTALLASAFAPFAAALTFALTGPDSTEAERR
jgi:predicted MFS family arabinose efflux permease